MNFRTKLTPKNQGAVINAIRDHGLEAVMDFVNHCKQVGLLPAKPSPQELRQGLPEQANTAHAAKILSDAAQEHLHRRFGIPR